MLQRLIYWLALMLDVLVFNFRLDDAMTEERKSFENGIDALWVNGKIVGYIVKGSNKTFSNINDARAFRDNDIEDTDTDTSGGPKP